MDNRRNKDNRTNKYKYSNSWGWNLFFDLNDLEVLSRVVAIYTFPSLHVHEQPWIDSRVLVICGPILPAMYPSNLSNSCDSRADVRLSPTELVYRLVVFRNTQETSWSKLGGLLLRHTLRFDLVLYERV